MPTTLRAVTTFLAPTDFHELAQRFRDNLADSTDESALQVAALGLLERTGVDQEWQTLFASRQLGIELQGLPAVVAEGYGGVPRSNSSNTFHPVGEVTLLRSALSTIPPRLVAKKGRLCVEDLLAVRRKWERKDGQTPFANVKCGRPNVKCGRLSSAKLNYVVDQLLRHPNDNFAIFANPHQRAGLILPRLSQILDLCVPDSARDAGRQGHERAALELASCEGCQVVLSYLNGEGTAFNLSRASQVIVLEPVVDEDLNLEAILSAHGLETKPVSILVAKNTYEHALVENSQGAEATTDLEILEALPYLPTPTRLSL